MIEYKSGRLEKPNVVGGSGVHVREQKVFVDEILCPACELLGISSAYPHPLSFESASRFGVGHSSLRLKSHQIQSFIDNMRLVIDSSEHLSVFQDFFIASINHGLKMSVPVSDLPDLINQCMAYTCIDSNSPHFRLHCLHLDLAVSLDPPSAGGVECTGLWGDFDFTIRLLANVADNGSFIGKVNLRVDPFCGFEGLGGYRFLQQDAPVCSISAYGLYKEPFFKRNSKSDRQGSDMTADELFHQTRGLVSWKVIIFFVKVVR